jgi:hypothetical protein
MIRECSAAASSVVVSGLSESLKPGTSFRPRLNCHTNVIGRTIQQMIDTVLNENPNNDRGPTAITMKITHQVTIAAMIDNGTRAIDPNQQLLAASRVFIWYQSRNILLLLLGGMPAMSQVDFER